MGKKKKVIKKDLEGNELERYDSAVDAAKANNTTKFEISRICIGKRKSKCDFTFEYSSEEEVEDESDKKVKCPYCDIKFKTFNGLCKHILMWKNHGDGITKEQLLTDYSYNGIRPLCKCGCGEYTEIAYDGCARFRDYKWGHSSRINNNWGHNIIAQINSTNTRRKQYSEGTRIQWNKGVSYDDAFGTEKAEELKTIISERMHKMIQNQEFNISSKLEEYFEETYLKPLNIKYKKQFFLKEIKQYCDFFLEDYNVIIEIDGRFWHADPRFFLKPTFNFQNKKIESDIIKNSYLINNGYRIIRFWEDELKKDNDYVVSKLNMVLFNDFEKFTRNFESENKFVLIDLLNESDIKNKPNFLLDHKKTNPNTIFIYEDEWLLKKEIVKSRIYNILGKTNNVIFARKCVVQNVSRKETIEFLETNHIQGFTNSSINYGLFYNNELISIMTFGNLRKSLGQTSKDGSYELIRFCNKLNTIVVGGASKLFKHFITDYNPKNIVSYCDKRWSNGNLYEKLNFKKDHESQPNYFYIIGTKRVNRFNYRKDVLIENGFDENDTEKNIMVKRNINRIYDCGSIVYRWETV